MVWGCACGFLDILIYRLFYVTFSTLWTCHFSTSVYRQWEPCEGNSSHNFIPIFLKFCTCFLHGLKMCIWFGYNPCINFYHFFHFVNFVIFWPQILWKCIDSGYLVSAALLRIFILIFLKPCTCFLHGLEMYMWFGYNPWINFCHFSILWTVIFSPQIVWKCINRGYLVSATHFHAISYLPLCNFAHLFSMVWRCACGWDLILLLIFGTFPLVNFVIFQFFTGATSTSPKFDLYFGLLLKNSVAYFTCNERHFPLWASVFST